MDMCPWCENWKLRNNDSFCGNCGAPSVTLPRLQVTEKTASSRSAAKPNDKAPRSSAQLELLPPDWEKKLDPELVENILIHTIFTEGTSNKRKLVSKLKVLRKDQSGKRAIVRVPETFLATPGSYVRSWFSSEEIVADKDYKDNTRQLAYNVQVSETTSNKYLPNITNRHLPESNKIDVFPLRSTQNQAVRLRFPISCEGDFPFVLKALSLHGRPLSHDKNEWRPMKVVFTNQPLKGLKYFQDHTYEVPKGQSTIDVELNDEALNKINGLNEDYEVRLRLHRAQSEHSVDLNYILRCAIPPAPRLIVSDVAVKAVSGRPGRFPLMFINEGGRSYNVPCLTWKLLDSSDKTILAEGSVENPLSRYGDEDTPIYSGQEHLYELNPEFPKSVKPGRYLLSVSTRLLDGKLELSESFEVSLQPEDKTLDAKDYICIDFGTTESGATLFREGEPQVTIELGVPSIQTSNGVKPGRPFIPTELYSPQSSSDIETFSLVPGSAKDVRYANLKWLNAQEGPVSAQGVTPLQLLTQYLKIVKNKIETHPKIGARLRKVFVTKPAIFTEMQLDTLKRAYETAGFDVRSFDTIDGTATLLSESWAPLPLLFPKSTNLLNQTGFFRKPSYGTLKEMTEKQFSGGVKILTIDVGGGSTDISLFSTTTAGRTLLVTEEVSETSQVFAGNRFRDMIMNILMEYIDVNILPKLISKQTVPCPKPTPTLDVSRLSMIEAENFQALAKLSFFFQSDRGAFYSPVFPFEIIDFYKTYSDLNPTDRESEKFDMERCLEGEIEAGNTDPRLNVPFIELKGRDGIMYPITLSPEQVNDLASDIVKSFHDNFFEHIEGIIEDLQALVSQSANAEHLNGKPWWPIISGRGSLFPVCDALIGYLETQKTFLDKRSSLLNPQAAKQITTEGGAVLAYMVENGLPLTFKVAEPSKLSLLVSQGVPALGFPEIRLDLTGAHKLEKGDSVYAKLTKGQLKEAGSNIIIQRNYPQNDSIDTIAKIRTQEIVSAFSQKTLWLVIERDNKGNIKAGLSKAGPEGFSSEEPYSELSVEI